MHVSAALMCQSTWVEVRGELVRLEFWVPGVEFKSSGLAAGVFICLAISQAGKIMRYLLTSQVFNN